MREGDWSKGCLTDTVRKKRTDYMCRREREEKEDKKENMVNGEGHFRENNW